MQILHLLSLALLTALSANAGYFDTFTSITKDQLVTPKSATLVAGGLGIWSLGYCVKDLWRVSNALYQGDEAVAQLKRSEIISGPHYKAHKANDKQALAKYEGLAELLSTDEINDYHTGQPSKYYKMLASLGRLNTKAPELKDMNKDNEQSVQKAYDEVFEPMRQKEIAKAKTEFKWRVAKDISMMAAISAVGYGAYTLINK